MRDSLAHAVDMQKLHADSKGRKNFSKFKKNSLVLLSTANLPIEAVDNVGAKKLLPRFIGPFKVLKVLGDAYTLDIPSKMQLHPTFYVGRLKPYHHGFHPSDPDPTPD